MKAAMAAGEADDSRLVLRSYTLAQCVELIGTDCVSIKTLRRAIHLGRLKAFTTTPSRNAKLLVRHNELVRWLNNEGTNHFHSRFKTK